VYRCRVITRRSFVVGALATGCIHGVRTASKQPLITHGVQAGDVGGGRAVIWARCDEPARMVVEWATTASFAGGKRIAGEMVTAASDFTGTVGLRGLPDGQSIVYRVRFEREAERGASAWVSGRFQTPRADRVRFVWTGDTCGQGFGRNPDWGGLRGYAAMRAAEPAFLLHSGDLIYADNPIVAEMTLPDGRVWRNVTNERVGRVAQELDDFRARFAYNLDDEHVRALAAEVPILAQWDDHETHNNWWPGQELEDDRYTKERDASKLAAMARRATFEWTPITRGPTIHRVVPYGPLLDVFVVDLRTFRTPNDDNRGTAGTMLGAAQERWLVDAVTRSTARWKVIACDQPISLVIGDGPGNVRQEGYAQGDGPPAGRELELASVLTGIAAVPNVVWLTADVHYAAAHHYDPARATGAPAFRPFWEFVAGPIHAGTFGPNALDPTFGPELKFQWVPPAGTGNLAPWDGMQTFGAVDVAHDALRVAILDVAGTTRYAVEIPA
jgi:alkaline phosphatase D